MNKFLFLIGILYTTGLLQAQTQETGTIAGKLLDQEIAEEPLPFANVVVKGTSKGATTNIEGKFSLSGLEPSTYTIVFSYVGYETVEVPNVKVVAGKVTEINTELGSDAAALDEVLISVVSRKDSETALLLEQKKAITIKESIGAQELAKVGVSNAASATTKISGVTKSAASGDIFVRGLGDRYRYTTINGLPVPSDNVERKNIDPGLFSTRILQNVSISKTFSVDHSADQASGSINIETRELTGNKELGLGLKAGVNTNVLKKFNDFRVTANQDELTAGFYDQNIFTESSLSKQSWNPETNPFPLNRKYGLIAGKEFFNSFRVLFTTSQSTEFEYSTGLFREYRENNRYDYFSDTETYSKIDNSTALIDLDYEINPSHRLEATSLFVNKFIDEVYEAGRNAEGVVFEETAAAENLNQFVRDQNIRQTRLWINQLHGFHDLSKKNELAWAIGYNVLDADEPNRIRNEFNIDGEGFIQLGRTGGFQQRKSTQKIDDTGFNALIEDKIIFSSPENADKNVFLEIGTNYRNKERSFTSRFFGITESTFNTVHPSSLDDLSDVFNTNNFDQGFLERNVLPRDIYEASLESSSGYASLNYGLGRWNINLGGRYQQDELEVAFDVNNYPSTLPQFSSKAYQNLYPALYLQFSPDEKSNIRFAASKTITLPEFKEIAPFQYVSQTGQVTRGNPELEASRNLNLDLKYEYFPNAGELISLTAFYKKISDPINKVQDRGAAGVFSYFNAGEQADVFGLELETNLEIYAAENPEAADFEIALNASRIWHEQDLKDVYINGDFIRTFRYNGKSEIGLQGASNWIFNAAFHLSTESDNPFQAALVANYASDKIYALGAPGNQTQTEVFYNDEIIEKGFVTLDLVLNKNLDQHWEIEFQGENLLNPSIKRIQAIRPSSTGAETNQVVRSYTVGSTWSIGINYSF